MALRGRFVELRRACACAISRAKASVVDCSFRIASLIRAWGRRFDAAVNVAVYVAVVLRALASSLVVREVRALPSAEQGERDAISNANGGFRGCGFSGGDPGIVRAGEHHP
jgi:hypothetical protein